MKTSEEESGAAGKVWPVSVFGEIADQEQLMIGRPGLVGWLSAMPVVYAIRAAKLLYRGIPTPLTGDNAAASVNHAGRRGASKALLLICLAAVPALMFGGDAIALPFGAFGVVAPQLGIAASIPVVGVLIVGTAAAAAVTYTIYKATKKKD